LRKAHSTVRPSLKAKLLGDPKRADHFREMGPCPLPVLASSLNRTLFGSSAVGNALCFAGNPNHPSSLLQYASCGKLRAPIFSTGHHRLSCRKLVWPEPTSISQARGSGGDGDHECGRMKMGFIEGGGCPASHGECGGCDRALYQVARAELPRVLEKEGNFIRYGTGWS
jgi:hypothetical protein